MFSGKVTLDTTPEELRKYVKTILKKCLKSANSETFETLANSLISDVLKLKFKPSDSFYLDRHRKGVADFRRKMVPLIEAIELITSNPGLDSNMEVYLNCGTELMPKRKKYKLPAGTGANFLVEFKSFLLDYYERNPVFKYYRGLDPHLSLESIQNLNSDRRSHPLDEGLEFKAKYYYPHRVLLSTIRKINFKKNKSEKGVLSNYEGRIVLMILKLIRYDKIYFDLKREDDIVINTLDIEGFADYKSSDIKKLNNDLISYYKVLDKYYSG